MKKLMTCVVILFVAAVVCVKRVVFRAQREKN